MSIYFCAICSSSVSDIRKLSKHIRDRHDIKSKHYYDTYIKLPTEGKCTFCGEEAKFDDLRNGYKEICTSSECISRKRSIGASKFRSTLKCDKVRYDQFISKVATNQSKIWEQRKITDEYDIICQKIGKKVKKNAKKLTAEQRKEKFGWVNKLDPDARQRWLEDSLKTGMHRWWKTAPTEEIIEKVFSMSKRYLQGQFKALNPQKYRGDPTRIFYRSSLELRCMTHFDSHQDVIWWSSEEIVVPYKDAGTGKNRRYFPDFVVNIKTKEGSIETLMIEVKPSRETTQPSQPKGKSQKKFLKEAMTWATNSSKWSAAERYCLDRKWKFTILTEKDILGLKSK